VYPAAVLVLDVALFYKRACGWGHSTTRAALIYQHRTAERDRLIAAMMSEIIEAELADPDNPSGTQRAREDHDGS
jgi:hypothetical protein